MYTTNSELTTATVPAFISKLWTLVEDQDTNELICWDPSGRSFHVLDQTRFAKEILPLYFKHNNMASFIRQLNMYGFRKVITVEAANIKMEKDDVEFAHPCFIQGQEALLEFIKRKAPNPKPNDSGGIGHAPEDLSKVYADVAAMKGRQDSLTTKLEHLKIENEVLWKELVSLRQRHMKQEQIVNKLIQFLVTLVGDRTLGGMKRKFPLMLQDASTSDSLPPPTKIPRTNEPNPHSSSSPVMKLRSNADNLEPLAILKDGEAPTLELTDLLEEVDDSPMGELFQPNDLSTIVQEEANELIMPPTLSLDSQLSVAEPIGSDLSSLVSYSTASSSPVTTVAKTDTSLCNSDFDKSEMTTHLDILQSDIDNIRDLFVNGQYSFDSNTLFELFNSDSALLSTPKVLFSPDVPYLTTPNALFEDEEDNELSALQKSKAKNESSGTVVGNELIQYNPPPEDFSNFFETYSGEPPSFVDPIDLHVHEDLENLFETNPLLSGSSGLDHQ